MISLIGNRPVLQVGRHHVADYDTGWLVEALERAAAAADLDSFPLLEEIGAGIDHYLEHKCPLRLLPVATLHDRVRRMLESVGCASIARLLAPCAPPVTVSLIPAARDSGAGFELAFFETIRSEILTLAREGVSTIHFSDHRAAVQLVAGRDSWDDSCQRLLDELEAFLAALHPRPATAGRQRLPA